MVVARLWLLWGGAEDLLLLLLFPLVVDVVELWILLGIRSGGWRLGGSGDRRLGWSGCGRLVCVVVDLVVERSGDWRIGGSADRRLGGV